MSLFSFLKKTTPAILIFHDHHLTLLQVELDDKGYELIGFNEVELEPGIVQDGKIMSMGQFKDVLVDLFAQAQPHSIKTSELWVNIPFHLLYTFVEDFLHKTKKDSLQKAMLKKVREHSPVPTNELLLSYCSSEKGHKTIFAAYASPKKWQDRLLKACKEVGINTIEYVPEPAAHMALLNEGDEGNFALFSFHEGQIFLSLFYQGLIYDSYFLSNLGGSLDEDCTLCFAEFTKAQEDFLNHFNEEIENLYFVGFKKDHQENIQVYFKEKKIPLIFLNGKSSGLNALMPHESHRASLFGMFNVLVVSQKKD